MQKVLFVCAENAGRSQMAEAFFNFYAKGSDLVGESSGTMPAKIINPVVIEAMKEKGIDILGKSPKLFDPSKIDEYARVISLGCLVKEAFADNVQKRIEDWVIDDPRDKSLEEIREIRGEIEIRIKELLQQLNRPTS